MKTPTKSAIYNGHEDSTAVGQALSEKVSHQAIGQGSGHTLRQ